MGIADRIESLSDAHREPVMLLYGYLNHRWAVWIAPKGLKGIHLGWTADEALRKAEHVLRELDPPHPTICNHAPAPGWTPPGMGAE